MSFDLNKVIAEQPKTRAKKRFTFDFDDNTYTLPNEIDAIALQSAATGFVTDALERLLGPVQWATLRQSPTVLKQDAIIELLRVYYAHVGGGTTVGESAASSRSSKSTARPSKRTSKRTTASRSRSSGRR